MSEEPASVRRLRMLARLNVVYVLAVILWGAWVRVSFSGDGCGDHWPLCHGLLVPSVESRGTAIELFHRLTSGLCGVFAIGLVLGAHKSFPAGHPARRYAWLGLLFVITEGAFGAALVKLRLVATDTSIERAYVMALHLCNTFALLFVDVGVALAADLRLRIVPSRRERLELGIALLVLLLVGTTGGVTALGDTLFPEQTFEVGLVADFDPGSHPFLRLRVFHPLFAMAMAAYLLYVAGRRLGAGDDPQIAALRWLVVLVLAQVGAGFASVVLGAPAALQIVHLGLADGVLIALAVLAIGGAHGASSTSASPSPLPASST